MLCMILSELPNWPARLDSESAAKYLGIGQTKFREGVLNGRYPQPVRDGGRVLWSKLQLDKFVAKQFDLTQSSEEEDRTWDDLN